MMPKEGDVTTVRNCDFCGNHLAEYRGVVETTPTATDVDTTEQASSVVDNTNCELFFCNYEHQADFHAGKTYQ
jgi:uncharacterized protein